MSVQKEQFGTLSQAITVTIDSLSAGSARESNAIDNSTNLFIDAILGIKLVIPNSGSVSGLKAVNIWFAASEDGTHYTDNTTGGDGGLTMRTTPNLFGPFVCNIPAINTTYYFVVPSVASFFGGVLPYKWSVVVDNQCGDGLSTGNVIEYTGLYNQII